MKPTTITKTNKAIQKLLEDLGRKPYPEEVATELGIPVSYLQFLGGNIDWSNMVLYNNVKIQ